MSGADLPYRKSPRLQGFDYSSDNAYFVTICCRNRECLLGVKQGDQITLSKVGLLTELSWAAIPQHFPNVELDAYVVMPNHIHGILILSKNELQTVTIGRVINVFKGAVTRAVGKPIWQSRYHDHIVRDRGDAERIRTYIDKNPARWEDDELFEG